MFGRKTKYPSKQFYSSDSELNGVTDSGESPLPNPPTVAIADIPAQESGQIQEKPLETEDKQLNESDLTASVSRNTVFCGNITSKDNIEIFGEVEGCISSSAVVKVYGKVSGDITCGILVANNAVITGNIISEKSIVIGNDTDVRGDIKAAAVSICGKVNGNVNALESVSVSSNGAVYGDITTPTIEISKGAVVYGAMVMEQPQPASSSLTEKNKTNKEERKKNTQNPIPADNSTLEQKNGMQETDSQTISSAQPNVELSTKTNVDSSATTPVGVH